ncbi:hypothetical protein EHO57_13810 [Leptospira langatensis]|uniref:Uncharacterized protein n=1 Tax=Leptospira langatensis TaxID=2484983 RepID=A0A5R2ASZ4_9LEPT|nr:hypothetical protein [Leptospira langatensis]TGJ99833.1 hypothetical protein EHO57_13810 [Leptospira langatensis]
MRKVGKGGSTPFEIGTKPNQLTPLTNEELLNRRGESAIWYRMSPCPCPSGDQIPDCPFCYSGLIRTFQEELIIQEELAERVTGNCVFTRYAPISKIDEAKLFQRGSKKDLSIMKVHEDHFEVLEPLKYWNQVELKYRVKMIEEIIVEGSGSNEYVLFPKLPDGALTGVVEVFKIPEIGEPIPVKYSGFTLNSIVFPERVNGLHRAKIKFVSAIKIGYKTFNVDPSNKPFDKSQLTFQSGELMGVLGSGYRIGEGDIITLLVSKLRHSEYIHFKPNGKAIDKVAYSPIFEIDSIISKERDGLKLWKQGRDYILFGDSEVQWLTDKPRGGYTIIYDYHPSFRVTGFIEAGDGENRPKPRIFKMKPVSSFNARD